MTNNKPKVVFTFVEAGLGHIIPAQAISDAFERKYGDKCEVVKWNIFSDTENNTVKKYGKAITGWSIKNCNNKLLYLGEMSSYLFGSKLTLKFLDTIFKKAKEEMKLADLLINLLTPIVVSMGASPADVANYVRAVEPQINIILIALAVMIVTSCLIPILVLVFFLWVVKQLTGVDLREFSAPVGRRAPPRRPRPDREEYEAERAPY